VRRTSRPQTMAALAIASRSSTTTRRRSGHQPPCRSGRPGGCSPASACSPGPERACRSRRSRRPWPVGQDPPAGCQWSPASRCTVGRCRPVADHAHGGQQSSWRLAGAGTAAGGIPRPGRRPRACALIAAVHRAGPGDLAVAGRRGDAAGYRQVLRLQVDQPVLGAAISRWRRSARLGLLRSSRRRRRVVADHHGSCLPCSPPYRRRPSAKSRFGGRSGGYPQDVGEALRLSAGPNPRPACAEVARQPVRPVLPLHNRVQSARPYQAAAWPAASANL
jgi:hypothetical protein